MHRVGSEKGQPRRFPTNPPVEPNTLAQALFVPVAAGLALLNRARASIELAVARLGAAEVG